MEIFNECYRVLKPEGSLWVNINDCFDNDCYNMVDAYLKVAMAQNGWMLHDEIIWNKRNPVPVGALKSQRTHEYIFQFKKSKEIFYNPQWLNEANSHFNGIIFGLKGVRRRVKSAFNLEGNFFNGIGADTGRLRQICIDFGIESMDHSATFPSEIPYLAVQLTSKPGDIVLDPFSGTGTTGMVALGLGRKYVGYELNTSYIEGSIARLTSFEVIDVAA
jgi:DNA modification methylase